MTTIQSSKGSTYQPYAGVKAASISATPTLPALRFGQEGDKPLPPPPSFKDFGVQVAKVFGGHSAKKGFVVHKGWKIPGGHALYQMRNGFRTPSKEEEIQALSDKIWTKLLKPLMDNPAETRRMLLAWNQQFKTQATGKNTPGQAEQNSNPMSEEFTGKGLEFLLRIFNEDGSVAINQGQSAMSHEEATDKLKLVAHMLALAYESGLERKVANLYKVVQSPEYQNGSPAQRGMMTLNAMDALVKKFFQTLWNAPGVFSDELKEATRPVFEDNIPIPVQEIKNTIQSDLGRPVEELFDRVPGKKTVMKEYWDPVMGVIEKRPYEVATEVSTFREDTPKAGSIAQVHQAKINSQKVAVKVVKSEVEQTIEQDLELLTPLVKMAEELYPDYDLEEYLADFKKLMRNECNMSSTTGEAGEAQVMEKCRELYRNDARIVVPEIYPELTSRRVLTMSWLKGKSLNAFIGSGNKKVASGYFSVIWDQIFKLGAFQADPHPGNIFYDPENDKFGILDFGLVCFTPPREKMDQYSQFTSVMPQDELLTFAKMLITLFSKNLDAFADNVLEPTTPEFYKKLAGVGTEGLESEEAARLKTKGDKLKQEYAARFGVEPDLANADEQTLANLNTLHAEKKAQYVKKLAANYPDVKSLQAKPILMFLKDAKKFASEMGLETRYINALPWKALFVAINVARDIDPNLNMPMLMMNKLYQTFRDNGELGFLVQEGATLMGTEILERATFDNAFNLAGKGAKAVGSAASSTGRKVRDWWRGNRNP